MGRPPRSTFLHNLRESMGATGSLRRCESYVKRKRSRQKQCRERKRAVKPIQRSVRERRARERVQLRMTAVVKFMFDAGQGGRDGLTPPRGLGEVLANVECSREHGRPLP